MQSRSSFSNSSKLYSKLLPAIDEICKITYVPDARAKRLGLKHQLLSFNFILAMNVMEPILRAVVKVSSTLQAPVLDLLSAVQIIKSLKKFMCNMRNSSTEYDQIFKTTIDICKKK